MLTEAEAKALLSEIKATMTAVEALDLTPEQRAVVAAHHAKLAEGQAALAARWEDLFPGGDKGVHADSVGGDK